MWLIHQFDSLPSFRRLQEYPNMAKAKTPRTNTSSKNQRLDSLNRNHHRPKCRPPQPELKEIKRTLSEVRQNVFLSTWTRKSADRALRTVGTARTRTWARKLEHWMIGSRKCCPVQRAAPASRRHSARLTTSLRNLRG